MGETAFLWLGLLALSTIFGHTQLISDDFSVGTSKNIQMH